MSADQYVDIPVNFPHDGDDWVKKQTLLVKLQQTDNIFEDMITNLTKLSKLIEPSRNIFNGLFGYLREVASQVDIDKFLTVELPTIAKLACECYKRKPETCVYILQQQARKMKLDRRFTAGVVACGFLCLWPTDLPEEFLDQVPNFSDEMPFPNFDFFFSSLDEDSQQAKLKCILHYFYRLHKEMDSMNGEIIIERVCLRPEEKVTLKQLTSCSKPLCPVAVKQNGSIEEAGSGVLQLDFANEFLGGGVVHSGNVQEEIRFVICPELISVMLFMQCMAPNEAILIEGFEQYSAYTGYGGGFQFAGDFQDKSGKDSEGNLLTSLCAIDAAAYFQKNEQQFTSPAVNRDLNKAVAGFKQPSKFPWPTDGPCVSGKAEDLQSLNPTRKRVIATGNWGCGIFGGNAPFKSLLQWIAASYADCPGMIYYTFQQGDMGPFESVVQHVVSKNLTVADLGALLEKFCVDVQQDLELHGQRKHDIFHDILQT